MATEKTEKENCKKWKGNGGGAPGAVYGLGMIGSMVYFIQHATSFPNGLLGVLKALVWPALLIYKVFELLKF
jgi:hypothetical protein